jgi:chemotaxis protein MotB
VPRDQYVRKEQEAARYKADWEAELEKARAIRTQFAALRGDVETLQAEARDLQERVKQVEAQKAQLEKQSNEYARLAKSLEREIQAGRVELTDMKGRLTVKMKDKILFASGKTTIGPEGLAALAKVAETLSTVQGKVIRVEGHTDNVPTRGGPFATNWELSTARALAVVRYLQQKGVDPGMLAAAGYGEYQPIASNATPEGRSLNRRIEIVLAAAQK